MKQFGGIIHFQTEHIILRKQRANEHAHVAERKIAHQIGNMRQLILCDPVMILIVVSARHQNQAVGIEYLADIPVRFKGIAEKTRSNTLSCKS